MVASWNRNRNRYEGSDEGQETRAQTRLLHEEVERAPLPAPGSIYEDVVAP